MYESHYGISAKPFQLNPDPAFFYASAKHRKAISYLEYGLEQREGFIVITGPIGTGKTMIAQSLLKSIETSKIEAIQIVTSNLSPTDLLSLIAKEFKIDVAEQNKALLIEHIHSHLLNLYQQGRYALILVDEAQNLPIETIEELRMLSNFQQNNQPLLQSFLLGQAELKEQLQSPAMEQFRQRIIASFHLQPLNQDEVKHYIEHRLKQAGLEQPQILTGECYDLICNKTLGVPRKINLLMDRVLLYGFLNELHHFEKKHIEVIIDELSLELGFSSNSSYEIEHSISQEETQNDNQTEHNYSDVEIENASKYKNKLVQTLTELDLYLQHNINKKVKINKYLDKIIKQKNITIANKNENL